MRELFGELRRIYKSRNDMDPDTVSSRIDELYKEIIATAREAHLTRRASEQGAKSHARKAKE